MAFYLTPESVLDGATLEQMGEYRHAAEKIAQGQFTPATRHLWMPRKDASSDGATQVQVFIIEGNYKHSEVPEFKNAFELIQHYETPPPGGNEPVNRRLYVVQNANSDICELLGHKLDVPPEVFLAHCDGCINLSLVDDGFTQRDHSTYWRVPVPHKCMVDLKNARSGKHYFHTGCIDRGFINHPNRYSDVYFFNFVSYWARSYGQDGTSWTAIILVDTHDSRLRLENSELFTELTDFVPVRRLGTEVVVNRTKTETSAQPYARSFFDTLVSAHNAQSQRPSEQAPKRFEDPFSPAYTEDPFSATVITQNLVRAAWEEFINRQDWIFRDDQTDDYTEHFISREPLSTKKMLERDFDNVKDYHEWVNRRRTVESWRIHLDTIMDAFNIRQSDGDKPPGNGCSASKTAQEGDEVTTTNQSNESTRFRNLRIEKEGRTWSRLQKKLAEFQADIASHMEMFAQRAAFEQAFAANRQARSAGQLTKLATVIVPCTFVASIFSMGGDFAAGERLFSVYWAISVPVTLALLAWILHDDVQRVWKNPVSKKVDTSASRLRDSWGVLRGRKFVAVDNDKVMEEGGT